MGNSELSQKEKSIPRRIAGLMGIILVQIVIFMVILEIIGRVFDPIGISYFPETARLFDEVIIEEPIGYRFPPGMEGTFYGSRVEINEHGMRDRPVPEVKEPGEFRLLMMGDSIIFSVGVAYEDSIPVRVEELANKDAPPGRRYRMLNMGVPSYNTEQELEQLKQKGLYLQADAALLYIASNDLQEKMWVLEKRGDFLVDISQRSYAMGLAFYAGRFVLDKLGFSVQPAVIESMMLEPEERQAMLDSTDGRDALKDYQETRSAEKLSHPRWLAIENSLIEIAHILKAQNIPLHVAFSMRFRDTFEIRLQELARQEGFSAKRIDIWNDERWISEHRPDYLNSPVDSHCNPAGCKITATVLYEDMLAAGLLN